MKTNGFKGTGVFLASMLISGSALASLIAIEPSIVWEYQGGPNSESWSSDVIVLDGGDLLTIGNSRGKTTESDGWLMRLTGDGDVLWMRNMPQPGWQTLLDVVELEGGDLAAAGLFISQETGSPQAWMVRFDGDGQIVEEHTFGHAGIERIDVVQLLPDAGLVVAATEEGAQGGSSNWVRAFDISGALRWERAFQEFGWFSGLGTDGSGGVYALGTVERDGWHDWAVRLDSDGEILWEVISEREDGGLISGHHVTAGGVVAIGRTPHPSMSLSRRDRIVAFDAQGQEIWAYASEHGVQLEDIVELSGQSLAAVGSMDEAAVMLFLDAAGAHDATEVIKGSVPRGMTAVAATETDNLIGVGHIALVDDLRNNTGWVVSIQPPER